MKTPVFWNSKNILSTALLPFSWLYTAGANLHKIATTPETFSVPVICVGNLTAGGAGKTPVALYVGERLKQKNVKAFFLSRGYGGSLSGPVLVDPTQHFAREVGDEPLLLANVLPTVISKDRVKGAYYAIALGAEAIIMDDGLQNPSIDKTVSLVVVDGAARFGNQRIIPAGPLRESVAKGLARADAIILIGSNRLEGIPPDMPVLFATTTPVAAAEKLKGKKVLAFCGLAYPEKFFKTLAGLGVILIEQKIFSDHHPYSNQEIDALAMRTKTLDAALVTTAKDAARLTPEQRSQVNVVDIVLSFDKPEQLDALLDHATKTL